MALPLLPVMDYFIQTCNWAALLMDNSHCYGKVTLSPSLGRLLISVKSMAPLCKIPITPRHLDNNGSVSAAPFQALPGSKENVMCSFSPNTLHGIMGVFLNL